MKKEELLLGPAPLRLQLLAHSYEQLKLATVVSRQRSSSSYIHKLVRPSEANHKAVR